MLLLLFPFRTFGDSGTFKFIDRGISAGAFVDPIAAGVNHSWHLAIPRNIFIVVPGVPLCIDRGGYRHATDRRLVRLRPGTWGIPGR